MKKKFFRPIADLRFTIGILLLIACSSIIGTIIDQEQSLENYKLKYGWDNRLFGFLTWDIIIRYGFDHVYKTWWFLAFICLFGISLITCTFLQQLPSLKVARRCQFFRTANQFCHLKIATTLKFLPLNKLLFKIKKNNYSIFQQKNILYCYKGLTGRIAPIIVHFSMILILVGAIIASLFGFKAQEIIPKTETFYVQNILNNGRLSLIPKTSARINDFWITYTKKISVSQFYSDISLLTNDGNEIFRKTIYVNSPIHYKGLSYYQTDWNLISLRLLQMNNQIYEYPMINVLNNSDKLWLTWFPNSQKFDQGFTILMNNLEGYCSVYNEIGQFLGNLELNEAIRLNSSITIVDFISTTGLQIKLDPGLPFIYAGFFLLMFSTLISYLTYSQIWIIQNNKIIFIGGNTTRAIFDFELEFFKLIKS